MQPNKNPRLHFVFIEPFGIITASKKKESDFAFSQHQKRSFDFMRSMIPFPFSRLPQKASIFLKLRIHQAEHKSLRVPH